MPDVVGRARLGVRERAVGLDEEIEALGITLLGIGMMLLRKKAKDAMNRVVVRIRADLQQLVVVDERRLVHSA